MSNPETYVVLAIFAQLFFTFVVMGLSGSARVGSIRKRETRIKDVALGNPQGWSDDVRAISNVMNNQWETPTLFYAICLLGLYLQAVGVLFALLAWGYITTRIGHAVIYTQGNNVTRRFMMFGAGLALLVAMTITLFATWMLFER